ncbi:MAG: phytoene desaturase family protein [Pseudomonadales bacterium]
MTDFDAIIIGGGHNGLVCAGYLAKAGKKVLVLEARSVPGGCAATNEFVPGFKVSNCAQWLYQLSPAIIKDFKLKSHGLSFAAENLATIALDASENHLRISGDSLEGAGISSEDHENFRVFRRKMRKYAKLMQTAYEARPPKLVEHDWRDKFTMAKLGLGMKGLGKDDMSDLMRLILINIFDVMNETFASEQLRAALALDAVIGTPMGPRSPNTVFTYLHRFFGETQGFTGVSQVAGGLGALGDALSQSVTALGVEVRCNQSVTSINKTHDKATGVTLASGENLSASMIVSSADPVTTFRTLLGYSNVETGFARRIEHIRTKSGTAKIHLALTALPNFKGLDEAALKQRLIIAPTMNDIERAFNALKYDECSDHPALDISIPTLNDPSLAPPGQHVLSAIVQYAPHSPKAGWDSLRETFLDRVIGEIERYAPGISDLVCGKELLTPSDLEADFGMTGGNWHHGELTMDQVLMTRPAHGATQYRTPINGLYLCGAGSHPGGGLMGLAGKNAAQEIIRLGDAA